MKPNQLQWPVTLGILATGAALASAATATLKMGDPAPELQTGKWVQGEPVKEFQANKAYLVEFWATWCPPCRESIPHLNEIHKKYQDKGLVVIGQDCAERDESLVESFVKKMGDKMSYRVALDNKLGSKSGKMAETWMAAAGRNTIPTAFLVDKKGIIAWIGHPAELKEKSIEDVLADKFDVRKAIQAYEQQQKSEAELRPVLTAINQDILRKDWDAAMTKVANAEKVVPQEEHDTLDLARFNILIGKQDYAAAYKLASEMSDKYQDNALLQNELAWQIAGSDAPSESNLSLAETMATRANEAAKGKNPGILDTLARVKFMRGDKQEAIALQTKAAALAENGLKTQLEKVLDSYQKGELPKAD